MQRVAAALIMALAGAVVVTPPTVAGTASSASGMVVFLAAPGEVNHVTVSGDDPVTIYDAGAPIHAEEGCVAVSEHEVTCVRGAFSVRLRDGDDSVSFAALVGEAPWSFALSASGGPGDDYLVGGPWADVLHGQEGDDLIEGLGGWDFIRFSAFGDLLEGGPGDDVLRGGRGPDTLVGNAGADRMTGGPGRDLAAYWRKTQPIRVTLDRRANDGQRSEHDNVRPDVEQVFGSRLADVLIGDSSRNWLMGFGGDDFIRGRGGPDRLSGGNGADDLWGGPGDDFLVGAGDPEPLGPNVDSSRGADRLHGGRGRDRILSLDDGRDRVVDGGSGFDRAWVDRSGDPVLSVERVRFSYRGIVPTRSGLSARLR